MGSTRKRSYGKTGASQRLAEKRAALQQDNTTAIEEQDSDRTPAGALGTPPHRSHVSRAPIYTIGGSIAALGAGIFGTTLLWGALSGEHTDKAVANETEATSTDTGQGGNTAVVDLDELVEKLDERRETETVTTTVEAEAQGDGGSDGESDDPTKGEPSSEGDTGDTSSAHQPSHPSPERPGAPSGTPDYTAPIHTGHAGNLGTDLTSTQHLIVWGDTLSELALYYGVDMGMLARANNIENVDLIYAGDALSIPR